jgi:hypothetical protein
LSHQAVFFFRMRYPLDIGEQRINPLMEGIDLVTPVPMHRDEVGYGSFKCMVNFTADDMLIEHASRGDLLAVEIHGSSGA